jgi:hexosaminidase
VRLLTDAGMAAEAYRLGFGEDEITLNASGYAGFLYGLVTLGQMLRGARAYPETYGFPTAGTIEDAPYYR